jgi:hypothetical protein
MNIFQILGITFSIIISLVGIIAPKSTAKVLGINVSDQKGYIEIMSIYGGFLIGLSITALLLNSDIAFNTLAGGWIGSGIVRLIAIGKYKKFYPLSILLICLALFIGVVFLLG